MKENIRIKYKTQEIDNEANYKNNICIGGFFSEEGLPDNDYKNVVIGNAATSHNYKNVVIGDRYNCVGREAVCIGCESGAYNHSIAVSHSTQSNGEYGVTIGELAETKESSGVAIGANCMSTCAYGTAVGYSAKTGNYSIALGASVSARVYGISIGINCINSSSYVTAIGYNAGGGNYSTIIGHNARTIGVSEAICIGYNAKVTAGGIAIGTYCKNTKGNYIKFWVRSSSTVSTLAGVQFGNIILAVSGSNLTIKNATSFDIRPTLANGLPAPTNNNDLVTKEYVDNLIPDLTYYLTADMVYIPPETLPIDVSGMT
jgi:hypothetical protein